MDMFPIPRRKKSQTSSYKTEKVVEAINTDIIQEEEKVEENVKDNLTPNSNGTKSSKQKVDKDQKRPEKVEPLTWTPPEIPQPVEEEEEISPVILTKKSKKQKKKSKKQVPNPDQDPVVVPKISDANVSINNTSSKMTKKQNGAQNQNSLSSAQNNIERPSGTNLKFLILIPIIGIFLALFWSVRLD